MALLALQAGLVVADLLHEALEFAEQALQGLHPAFGDGRPGLEGSEFFRPFAQRGDCSPVENGVFFPPKGASPQGGVNSSLYPLKPFLPLPLPLLSLLRELSVQFPRRLQKGL